MFVSFSHIWANLSNFKQRLTQLCKLAQTWGTDGQHCANVYTQLLTKWLTTNPTTSKTNEKLGQTPLMQLLLPVAG
jgi:hypothetical protein